MNHNDFAVTESFRETLAKRFPGLQKRAGYWHLLGYLMYGTWRDDQSGELIIHAELLASMEGKSAKYASGNYKALELIQGFSRDVIKINWRAQDTYRETRARRVVSTEMPADIQALALDQTQFSGDGLVWLGSGKRVSANEGTRTRSMLLEQAKRLTSGAKCVEAKAALDYLNSLPPDRFKRKLNQRLDDALKAANALRKREDRERELKLLKAICDQPKPFYKPVSNSARLYSLNPSILWLRREIREELTGGWFTADLESAQLAIIAKLWDCPLTVTFLNSKRSIWASLFEHFDVEPSDKVKAIYKELLYRIAFGAGEASLKSFAAQLGSVNAFEDFIGHPVIDEIWSARERVKKKLNKEGVLFDAFGNELLLDKKAKFEMASETAAWYSQSNALSLLAQQAQSYELKVLWPAFEAAISFAKGDRHGFVITSYLHDGFTYTPSDKDDANKWQAWLKDAIEKQAQILGIPTRLVIKEL